MTAHARLLCLFCLPFAALPARAQAPALTGVETEALRIHPNLLANAGFEEVGADGRPTGWTWLQNNTNATCRTDDTVARRGRRSIRITNGTPFGAHVYSMLIAGALQRLEVGKPYTLSAWVRSDAPGETGLITGGTWGYRVYAQPTQGGWRRLAVTFTAGEADADCVVRISSEGPTRGVWIDDVKLEQSDVATPSAPDDLAAAPLEVVPSAPDAVIEGDGPFALAYTVTTPAAFDGHVEARIAGSARSGAQAALRAPLRLGQGAWRVLLRGTATAQPDTPRAVTVRLVPDTGQAASARGTVRFLSPAGAVRRTEALRKRLPGWASRLKALETRKADTSYLRTAYTVLDNFTGYAAEDARKGQVQRALMAVGDLEAMANRLEAGLRAAVARPGSLPRVPRYTGAERPGIVNGSFVGPARIGQQAARRPLFFNGFGHFAQVVADMEKWPAYGTNIIQIEIGPSVTYPAEGQLDRTVIEGLQSTLDRASKAGVAVCLLISPHYVPGWALEKWPHLRKRREGFLQYCLHAPEGHALMRRFLADLLTPVADHPALHSICLSNEPVNVEEPCEPAERLWHAWLKQRHGTPQAMSMAWGVEYPSFEAVPLPNPFGAPPPQPVGMDFARFNQRFFADWHRMLADAVHAAAPTVPVHAKAMTWTLLNGTDVRYGADATLFAGFSQINGNDSACWYGGGEWAQGWQMNAMGHDLQRSVLDAPVFNSENHLIVDRSTGYIPPAHIRAALWQAAVHGQGATAIWVWERTFDPRSDFAGSIMHRPGCAEAVGVVNHDLNRAAHEVTALQRAPARVLLLQSVTAGALNHGPYNGALDRLYTALAFTGVKAGFITEHQLEQGRVPDAPVLLVPAITHLSDAAYATLTRYRGRLVLVGEGDLLGRNEYGRTRQVALAADRLAFKHGPTTARQLWQALRPRLARWGVRPDLELLAGAGKQPAWGVEWRTARTAEAGGLVANLCNFGTAPATVTLARRGQAVGAVDVLTGKPVGPTLTLQPLEVRLLRLAAR